MAKRGKIKKRSSAIIETIKRPIRLRKYQMFCLIVCEDQSTEPYYFGAFEKLFPKETFYLKAVGTGRDPLGVTEQAIAERKSLEDEIRKKVDSVWVVFDKDDADENETKIQRFNSAFYLAEKESIQIAYSNEVFELWLLLHLANIEPILPLPRESVYMKLEDEIKLHDGYSDFQYIHGNSEIIDVVRKIGDEEEAVKRAEQLLVHHDSVSPLEANPSTKVHELIKELRDWVKYFNWKPEK